MHPPSVTVITFCVLPCTELTAMRLRNACITADTAAQTVGQLAVHSGTQTAAIFEEHPPGVSVVDIATTVATAVIQEDVQAVSVIPSFVPPPGLVIECNTGKGAGLNDVDDGGNSSSDAGTKSRRAKRLGLRNR